MAEQEQEERRRKYPRVKESCRVKYRVVKDPAMQPEEQGGVAINISGGGMCFSSAERLEPGVMVALELSLTELTTPVVALARVVWREPAQDAGGFDVGVEFWWVGWADAEAQGRMLQYVNEKLDELGIDRPDETE